jgi:hypothetical protein
MRNAGRQRRPIDAEGGGWEIHADWRGVVRSGRLLHQLSGRLCSSNQLPWLDLQQNRYCYQSLIDFVIVLLSVFFAFAVKYFGPINMLRPK